MSFESVLQSIVDGCGGGRSAALMGLDGIAIAEVQAATGVDAEDPLAGDVTTAGVEFGRIPHAKSTFEPHPGAFNGRLGGTDCSDRADRHGDLLCWTPCWAHCRAYCRATVGPSYRRLCRAPGRISGSMTSQPERPQVMDKGIRPGLILKAENIRSHF